MTIKSGDFVAAKKILARAGSRAVQDWHSDQGTGRGHPDSDGQDLINRCTREFQQTDLKLVQDGSLSKADLDGHFAMTMAHYEAIVAAKKKLGLR
ncbi:MAG: hypothetical protein AAGD47_09375 [Pseudomonadota bacterium]